MTALLKEVQTARAAAKTARVACRGCVLREQRNGEGRAERHDARVENALALDNVGFFDRPLLVGGCARAEPFIMKRLASQPLVRFV